MTAAGARARVRYVAVPADRAGQRLDNFLIGQLSGVPRSLIYRLVRTGQVRVNGARARPMRKLDVGDEVRIPPVQSADEHSPEIVPSRVEAIRACIIAREEAFLVLDKPAGMAVQRGSGLSWSLMDVLEEIEPDLRLVHRLDRGTSGLLVVARGYRAARELQRAFSGRRVEKRYLALLDGPVAHDHVTVDQPLRKMRDPSGQHRVIVADDGRPALTQFRVLHRLGGYSLVEAVLETGRTHQVRVHAAHLGQPIAGDELYNRRPAPEGLDRLFLHAHYLRLPWPEDCIFHAPLPPDLNRVADGLATAGPAGEG